MKCDDCLKTAFCPQPPLPGIYRCLACGRLAVHQEEAKAQVEVLRAIFPETVMLRFRTAKERVQFMGQLSDGWGENLVELHWPWGTGTEFDDVKEYGVTLTSEKGSDDA